MHFSETHANIPVETQNGDHPCRRKSRPGEDLGGKDESVLAASDDEAEVARGRSRH